MLYIDLTKCNFYYFPQALAFMNLTDFRDRSSSIDRVWRIDNGVDPFVAHVPWGEFRTHPAPQGCHRSRIQIDRRERSGHMIKSNIKRRLRPLDVAKWTLQKPNICADAHGWTTITRRAQLASWQKPGSESNNATGESGQRKCKTMYDKWGLQVPRAQDLSIRSSWDLVRTHLVCEGKLS